MGSIRIGDNGGGGGSSSSSDVSTGTQVRVRARVRVRNLVHIRIRGRTCSHWYQELEAEVRKHTRRAAVRVKSLAWGG